MRARSSRECRASSRAGRAPRISGLLRPAPSPRTGRPAAQDHEKMSAARTALFDHLRAFAQLIDPGGDPLGKEGSNRNRQQHRDHCRNNNVDVRPPFRRFFNRGLVLVNGVDERKWPADPNGADHLVFVILQWFIQSHLTVCPDMRQFTAAQYSVALRVQQCAGSILPLVLTTRNRRSSSNSDIP